MVPLPESKAFLELASRDFCWYLTGYSYAAEPSHTKETKKYSFLTGNRNTLSKTEVWSGRKEESMILEEQLAVSATVNKEIHYISQSPEAEQTAGSIQ